MLGDLPKSEIAAFVCIFVFWLLVCYVLGFFRGMSWGEGRLAYVTRDMKADEVDAEVQKLRNLHGDPRCWGVCYGCGPGDDF